MKTLLLLLAILLSFSVHGQINFNPSLEVGYEDRHILVRPDCIYYNLENNMFSIFEVAAGYKKFSLTTSFKTYMHPVKIHSYSPQQVEYIIGGQYKVNKIISLRAFHMCSHGVDGNLFNESYNKISIKLNFNQK